MSILKTHFIFYVEDQVRSTTFYSAVEFGAKELSPLMMRNWGDAAAYSSDPDGHVIAFAEKRFDN